MVARQQLGDIFLGITPSAIRQYMKHAFAGARGKYRRIVIPCAGRFTLAEAAVDAGWRPDEIECSDISLFSSVLGFACAGRDLDELGVAFHDHLQHLTAHARAREALPGAVLYGLKVCQLKADVFYERMVRDELIRDPATYVSALNEQVGALAEKLRGIKFRQVDITQHCEEVAGDADTIVYCNPPGFAKGYTRMFDTKGAITWSDPRIPEFDKSGRMRLYHLLMPAPALAFFFRSKAVEEGFGEHAVFAVEKGRGRDFVLCNRPNEARTLVKKRGETKITNAKLPFLPDEHEIRPQSAVGFLEVSKGVALYYRDLFAHKLPTTRAERYFLMTIDGYLAAVFGMFFSEVQTGRSGTVYEVFGFCAPNKRYPRLNHLFMTCICNGTARKYFSDQCHGTLREVERFQTTCISTTPEQKSHRSTGLKLVSREPWGDGRFKLVYGGSFRAWNMRQTIEEWLKKMRNVEKETGKAMGVTKMPNKLASPEEA
jgi:hypothetical protein